MIPSRQLLILLFALAALSTGDATENIHIGGTDLLEVVMETHAVTATDFDHSRIDVAMEGTLPALDALAAGRLDIALILDASVEKRDLSSYVRLPVGYMVIQVLVHESNPLDSIRVNRLAGIYGDSEDFDFYQWGDLGLEAWADRTIHPLAITIKGGLESEYFRHRVLEVPRFKRNLTLADSLSHLLDAIRSDQSAIGLAGFTGGDLVGVRVLPLTSGTSESAVYPSLENVHAGAYPLKVPLVLFYHKTSMPALREWLENFYSEDFAEQLESAGFMPVPKSARQSISRNFE